MVHDDKCQKYKPMKYSKMISFKLNRNWIQIQMCLKIKCFTSVSSTSGEAGGGNETLIGSSISRIRKFQQVYIEKSKLITNVCTTFWIFLKTTKNVYCKNCCQNKPCFVSFILCFISCKIFFFVILFCFSILFQTFIFCFLKKLKIVEK